MKIKMLLLSLIVVAAYAVDINPKLTSQFNKFKKASKCEFIITSGVRSVKHNKKVGGAKNSFHLHGKAYDIVPKCKKSLKSLAKIAAKYFNGVIIYKKHIHVDIGDRVYHKLE